MNLNIESKHKLRDMGAGHLLDALEAQDDVVCMGLTFAERIQMAVDEAYSDYVNMFVSSSGFQLGQRFFSRMARKSFMFGKGAPLPLFDAAS